MIENQPNSSNIVSFAKYKAEKLFQLREKLAEEKPGEEVRELVISVVSEFIAKSEISTSQTKRI